MYRVYMHTNKFNRKVYIGVTSRKRVKDRWGTDGKGYFKNSKFYKAILKYGWDNFEHIILFENLTREEAIAKEIELIKQYDSFKHGYNSDLGGSILSQESRANVWKTRKEKGYLMSEKVKKEKSIFMKSLWVERRKNGYKLSKETKEKISNSLKNNKSFNEAKKNRRYIKKDNISKLIRNDELEKYLLTGWILGRNYSRKRQVNNDGGN